MESQGGSDSNIIEKLCCGLRHSDSNIVIFVFAFSGWKLNFTGQCSVCNDLWCWIGLAGKYTDAVFFIQLYSGELRLYCNGWWHLMVDGLLRCQRLADKANIKMRSQLHCIEDALRDVHHCNGFYFFIRNVHIVILVSQTFFGFA